MSDSSHTDFFSTDLPTSNNPGEKNHENNGPKTGRSRVLKGTIRAIYHKEINLPVV